MGTSCRAGDAAADLFVDFFVDLPFFVDPVFVDPVFVDPVFVDPVFVEPVFVDPVFVEPVFADFEADVLAGAFFGVVLAGFVAGDCGSAREARKTVSRKRKRPVFIKKSEGTKQRGQSSPPCY